MTDRALIKSILPFLPDDFIREEGKDSIIIPYAPGYNPENNPVKFEEKKAEPFITGDQLRKIVINLNTERANELADLFNKILPEYGLDNRDMFHEFIAQIAHESAGFRKKEENMRYSAQRLIDVFGRRRFPDLNAAKWYAYKPEKIASRVYANRMGNGNEASGDGWTYRGGGFIHITGKNMYELYAKYKGISVEDAAFLVRTNDYYALDSACWYFCIYASLKDEAEKEMFLEITKAINGGTNGYQDRVNYYELAQEVLPIAA